MNENTSLTDTLNSLVQPNNQVQSGTPQAGTPDVQDTKDNPRDFSNLLIKDLTGKLREATTQNEKLRAALELQEAKRGARGEGKATPGLDVIGSYTPTDIHSVMSAPYRDNNPSRHYRFISNHKDLRSLRRSQGYVPVVDKGGNEVRYMDTTLASMPKKQYVAQILKPKEKLREHRRGAIKNQFYEQAEKVKGIKPFGDIHYDKGE